MDAPFTSTEIDDLVAVINGTGKLLQVTEPRHPAGLDLLADHDRILELLQLQDQDLHQEPQTPRLVALPTASDLTLELANHFEQQYDLASALEPTLSQVLVNHYIPELIDVAPDISTYSSSRVPSTDTTTLTVDSRAPSHFELLSDAFFPQEHVPAGTMFVYPNDGTESWIFMGQLQVGLFDAAKELQKTKQTVDQEFDTVWNFRKGVEKKPSPIDNHFQSLPYWRPVSLYVAAFTNVKPPIKLNAQYFLAVPYTSCFGRINMRIKRAWKRRRKENIVAMKPINLA